MWIRTCLATALMLAALGKAGDCLRCAERIRFQTLDHAETTVVDRLILSLIVKSPPVQTDK